MSNRDYVPGSGDAEAHLKGSLGSEIAKNNEQQTTAPNPPSKSRFNPDNYDPVLQNVSYVHESGEAHPDLAPFRNETEFDEDSANKGQGFVSVGPQVGIGPSDAVPRHSGVGEGIGYDRGERGYDTQEGGLKEMRDTERMEKVHVSGKSQPEGYMAP